MLKPQRKITRKEIKRDAFLETIDKLEHTFEQNKKTYINIGLGLIAGIFIINRILNNFIHLKAFCVFVCFYGHVNQVGNYIPTDPIFLLPIIVYDRKQ